MAQACRPSKHLLFYFDWGAAHASTGDLVKTVKKLSKMA